LSHTVIHAAPRPRHRPDDPGTACYPRQTPGRGDRSRSHYRIITQEIDTLTNAHSCRLSRNHHRRRLWMIAGICVALGLGIFYVG